MAFGVHFSPEMWRRWDRAVLRLRLKYGNELADAAKHAGEVDTDEAWGKLYDLMCANMEFDTADRMKWILENMRSK